MPGVAYAYEFGFRFHLLKRLECTEKFNPEQSLLRQICHLQLQLLREIGYAWMVTGNLK